MEPYDQLSTPSSPSVSTATYKLSISDTQCADLTDALVRSLTTENRRLHDALDHECIRDRVTGLFTRRYMEETLDRELFRANRRQDELCVIECCLDHFFQFEEQCGAAAANILLQAVAHVFKVHSRAGDIAYRSGASKFALILFETPLYVAHNRAEQLRKRIGEIEWCHNSQLSFQVTLSAGIAAFPEHATTSLLLLQAADDALHRAVENGANRSAIAIRDANIVS